MDQRYIYHCEFSGCYAVAAGFWRSSLSVFHACWDCYRAHRHYRWQWVAAPYLPEHIQRSLEEDD